MPFNDPNTSSSEPAPEDQPGPTSDANTEAVAQTASEPAVETTPPAETASPSQATASAAPTQATPPPSALSGVVVEARPRQTPRANSAFADRPGWLALIIAVAISVFFSTALTLGVLGVANRGLVYASPSQVLSQQSRLDTLQSRLDTQEKDLNGMRARLEAVEKLSGRTTALEQAVQTLRTDLDKRATDVESLRVVVGEAQKQITQVVSQSSAFEAFINGLRNLLDKLPPSGTNP